MESDIRGLEKKVDTLIKLCRQLKEENQFMKMKQDELNHNLERLEEKNRLAAGRVESIVDRLKEIDGK